LSGFVEEIDDGVAGAFAMIPTASIETKVGADGTTAQQGGRANNALLALEDGKTA
jgi:hypothetical protein